MAYNLDLSALLVDASGPVVGVPIIFYGALSSAGSLSEIGTANTDSTGTATITAQVSSAGTYNFEADFVGDSSDLPSKAVATFTINVTPPPPTLGSIELAEAPATVGLGGSMTFTATCYDTSGNPMAGIEPVLSTGQAFPASDSSGVTSLLVAAGTAGTFTFSASSGSIASNDVTVVVTTKPPSKTWIIGAVATAGAVLLPVILTGGKKRR